MKQRFEKNQKYITICFYTVLVVLISCVIIRVIFQWEGILAHLLNFISTLSSFVAGLLIAFIINPLILFLNRRVFKGFLNLKNDKLTKTLSLVFGYLIVFGCIVGCATYIIPQLIDSISDFSKMIQPAFFSFTRWLRGLTGKYSFLTSETVNGIINSLTPKITEFSTTLVSKTIPWLYNVSVSVVKWFVTIFIGIVVSIYLLVDKKIIFNAIKKVLSAFLSDKTVRKLIDICKESNKIFSGYIIAKAIDSIVVAILCAILMLIFGMPYAVLISVIICVTNMIPYFGPFLGGIPSVFILAVVKLRYGVIFAIIIVVLQQLDGVILNPKLLGESIGIRPLVVLLGVTLGGAYGGVLGMFLGVPVIAVIQYLVTLALNARLRKKAQSEKEAINDTSDS